MGISYRDNSQAGTISVGNITYIYLAMQNPDDIYAFNFHCALCDEIDEVPSDRVKKIVTAIQERCRKVMPKGKTMPVRDPFIFFSTTAQGLGGTYHLVKDFDKDKIPYAVIRGRTQDNTTLAKSQLTLLRKLYTEDEARAYLDGEFINLSNGRVYYEFNPKTHVCMRWKPKYDDVIYVGGDFNYKYNATVEGVERNGKVSVINAHYWHDMGEAARGLRALYPTQKIIFIPDASGKEIMQGFVEEFEAADITVFWNARNPSITERILVVNKLYRMGRLFIMQAPGDKESKVDHLIMCMETRDFDDNTGKPRKGSGPDAVDHPGDALEYMIWHIIHSINGYDELLSLLSTVGKSL